MIKVTIRCEQSGAGRLARAVEAQVLLGVALSPQPWWLVPHGTPGRGEGRNCPRLGTHTLGQNVVLRSCLVAVRTGNVVCILEAVCPHGFYYIIAGGGPGPCLGTSVFVTPGGAPGIEGLGTGMRLSFPVPGMVSTVPRGRCAIEGKVPGPWAIARSPRL